MLPNIAVFDRSVVEFVQKAHEGQFREDSITPYVEHPYEVADVLLGLDVDDSSSFVTQEMVDAALCHDVVEDCPAYTLDDVIAVIGPVAGMLVKELTNMHPEGTPFEVKHASLLKDAATFSDQAKIIKLCDRYCNLRDCLESWQPARVKRYFRASKELLKVMEPIPFPVHKFASEVHRLIDCII